MKALVKKPAPLDALKRCAWLSDALGGRATEQVATMLREVSFEKHERLLDGEVRGVLLLLVSVYAPAWI